MSDEDQHNRLPERPLCLELCALGICGGCAHFWKSGSRTDRLLLFGLPFGLRISERCPGIAPTTFDRMGHQPLSNLIEQYLGSDLQKDFDEMRDLREAINYLGWDRRG